MDNSDDSQEEFEGEGQEKNLFDNVLLPSIKFQIFVYPTRDKYIGYTYNEKCDGMGTY